MLHAVCITATLNRAKGSHARLDASFEQKIQILVYESIEFLAFVSSIVPLKASLGHLIPFQLGTFRSHDGDYFIEPLISPGQQEYEEEHIKPHVVYKHSVPPTDLPRDKQTCDTSGT